ncbi:MAG: DNA-3-methyladenine glycosylase [Desulfurococcales archaeon]|nr:DNA-3-methyladenine glycosylase [Desulfurococcales archaeon]
MVYDACRAYYEASVFKSALRILGAELRVGDRSIIVGDVEVYCFDWDPACNRERFRRFVMEHEPGTIFTYTIHSYTMLNTVAGARIKGLVFYRGGVDGATGNPISGPGRLTRHLGVDRSLHGSSICGGNRIVVARACSPLPPRLVRVSRRVGVRREPPAMLRYYIPPRRLLEYCGVYGEV